MGDLLRVGIVGAGGVSKAHLPAWLKAPGVQVVGVADLELERAAARAAEAGQDVLAAGSLDALLTAAAPDLIDVCTREWHHANVAIAALEAGRAVLCEKIMAGTLADGRRMVEAAASRPDQYAAVQYNYRFFPGIAKLAELLAAGTEGQLRLLSINTAAYCFHHLVDTALWLAGSEPVWVHCAGGRDSGVERRLALPDDLLYVPYQDVSAQVRFASGTLAVLNSSLKPTGFSPKIIPFQITAICDRSALEVTGCSWGGDMSGVCRRLPDGPNLVTAESADEVELSFRPSLAENARRVLAGEPPLVPWSVGWQVMLVSHGFGRSLEAGRAFAMDELVEEVT